MDYFEKLKRDTKTRFWINNPTIDEAKMALSLGTMGCTTNPAFCSRLINVQKEKISYITDEMIKQSRDDNEVALKVYQECTKELMRLFEAEYINSGGKSGFVTLQDNPIHDGDSDKVIEACISNKITGVNYMAKIPVIKSGLEAISACVEENIPICATEVFALSQVISVCDAYEKASKKSGNRPIMYVTHISGIFDEYLLKYARREKISIAEDIIYQAGNEIAKREIAILEKKGFTMLGGGARKSCHFTDFVGGNVHVTINWKTVEEVAQSADGFQQRINMHASHDAICELKEKFPDFCKAYSEDGLDISSFAEFGPVQLFRNAFLKGWYNLLSFIAERRYDNAI